jgi:cobalt-precorrin-5B (C1)-methyltransferase
VAAAERGVKRLLLFGYQGKLIKLAGGIFHTHHHLADGRAEVLTALAALEGLGGDALTALHGAATVEAALSDLEAADPAFAERLRHRLAWRWSGAVASTWPAMAPRPWWWVW